MPTEATAPTGTFPLEHAGELRHRACMTVGLDWGGTNLRAGLVSFDTRKAHMVQTARLPWKSGTSPEEAAQTISRLIAGLVQKAGCEPPVGLGLGLAAMVDPVSGRVLNAPNLGWSADPSRPIELARLLRDETGLPVVLHNDLSAIAWGERCFGAGKGADHMLCVFLGTGLGAAHIASGRLVEGAGGVATELGHLRLRPGKTLCGCGQQGCVEAYVGGRHITARLRRELQAGGPGSSSLVLELAGRDPEGAHPGHADRAAAHGDPYASALWEEIATLFATALAFGVTLLDPGLLVMGGTVWSGCPELQRITRERVFQLANPPALTHLSVVDAELGHTAGVLGAAALAALEAGPK